MRGELSPITNRLTLQLRDSGEFHPNLVRTALAEYGLSCVFSQTQTQHDVVYTVFVFTESQKFTLYFFTNYQ